MTENGTVTAIVSGAEVYWDCEQTRRSFLLSHMEAIGKAEFCPQPYSVGESIKAACREHLVRGHQRNGDDRIVQRHKNANQHGYEVVAVERGECDNEYTGLVGIHMEEQGGKEMLVCHKGSWNVSLQPMQDTYDLHRASVSGSAVGRMLVNLVQAHCGTTMRRGGAVYYVPEAAVADWHQIEDAVERANHDNDVRVHRVLLDERAAKDVMDGVTDELIAACQEVEALAKDPETSAKKLKNAVGRCNDLRKKGQRYEAIIKKPMESVMASIKSAEIAAAFACLRVSAGDRSPQLNVVG